MYSLVLGSGGLDSTGFTILMESLHLLWPKGRHVAIIPEKPCVWAGTASNVSQGIAPKIEHRPDFKKSHGWKDVYVAKCFPVDAMYYGINNSQSLMGFDNPFDLVITGVHHGEVVGLDVLHSSAFAAVALCSRTYGTPGMCIAQQMADPRQGDIDRQSFKVSERILGNLLTSISPTPGECIVVNVPSTSPIGPQNAQLADYQPRLPAKAAPYFKGIKTDIAVLKDNYVSVAECALSINSPVRL